MESGTETKTVKPAGVAGTWWPAGDGAGEVGRVWDPWRPDGGGHGEGQVCVVLPVTDGASSPGVDSLQPAGQTQTVFV